MKVPSSHRSPAVSEWYLLESGRETGPFTTDELVQMSVAGEIQPTQQLRKSGSVVPVPANRLAFLRLVTSQAAEPASIEAKTLNSSTSQSAQAAIARATEEEPSPDEALCETPALQRWRPAGLHLVRLLVGLCGLVAAVLIGGAWGWSPNRFPAPPGHITKYGKIVVHKPVSRPKRPQVPTLANVRKGHRVPLPGFETVETAFSPTLTADLKTIVYAKMHGKSGYDLFIATRNDVNKPFENHKRIAACSSAETDAFATMSPDGLDLVFMRSDAHPRLFHSTRNSTTASFGPPGPVEIANFDSELIEGFLPQLISDLDLIFLIHSDVVGGVEFLQASRKSRDDVFKTPRPVLFADPTPPYRMTSDLLRAYFGWKNGIWMTSRRSLTELFDPSHAEIPAEVTGEIDGPIYVSPQEDIFIFCGPTPGKKLGESRRLWVVQP
jgi:hypothetical protein